MGRAMQHGQDSGPSLRPQQHLILGGFAEEALKQLPDGSVHCIVTSPPYWGLRRYLREQPVRGGDPQCTHVFREVPAVGYTKERERDPKRKHLPVRTDLVSYVCDRCGAVAAELGMEYRLADYIRNLLRVLEECKRVLHPLGTLWLNLGDTYAARRKLGEAQDLVDIVGDDVLLNPALPAGSLVGVPWRVAMMLQAHGWVLRSDVIWFKPNPVPTFPYKRPTASHEHLFMFVKGKEYYYDISIAKQLARSGFGGQLQDVWEIQSGSELRGLDVSHPAPFPNELPRRCILLSTPEWVCEGCGGWGSGECKCNGVKRRAVVLDPFAGSGTVSVVAHRLGRSSVAVEAEPSYAQLACRRLQDETAQVGLFDAERAEVVFRQV